MEARKSTLLEHSLIFLRLGGGTEDEGLSQEQISRLLEDAMSSDLNFGDENNEGYSRKKRQRYLEGIHCRFLVKTRG